MRVVGDFLTPFKSVPVVLTLESVGKCSSVSWCKAVFLCELIIKGVVLEIKVSNPKSLLKVAEENQKEHGFFQKAQSLHRELGNSPFTRKSFHFFFFESRVGLQCCWQQPAAFKHATLESYFLCQNQKIVFVSVQLLRESWLWGTLRVLAATNRILLGMPRPAPDPANRLSSALSLTPAALLSPQAATGYQLSGPEVVVCTLKGIGSLLLYVDLSSVGSLKCLDSRLGG